MISERFPVGVVVERVKAESRWADYVWRVSDVLPATLIAAPWTMLAETCPPGKEKPEKEKQGASTRFYAGITDLVAWAADTKVYKHNIEAPQPSVYVVLRKGGGPHGWSLLLATVDPSEAHSHADAGDDLVEAVPMPRPVFDWLSAFVAAHHVERKEWRRKRDRADPEALAIRRDRPAKES